MKKKKKRTPDKKEIGSTWLRSLCLFMTPKVPLISLPFPPHPQYLPSFTVFFSISLSFSSHLKSKAFSQSVPCIDIFSVIFTVLFSPLCLLVSFSFCRVCSGMLQASLTVTGSLCCLCSLLVSSAAFYLLFFFFFFFSGLAR